MPEPGEGELKKDSMPSAKAGDRGTVYTKNENTGKEEKESG